jgi:hypothetical protein
VAEFERLADEGRYARDEVAALQVVANAIAARKPVPWPTTFDLWDKTLVFAALGLRESPPVWRASRIGVLLRRLADHFEAEPPHLDHRPPKPKRPRSLPSTPPLHVRNLLKDERVKLTDSERIWLKGDQVVRVLKRNRNERVCEVLRDRGSIESEQCEACDWLFRQWTLAGLDHRVTANLSDIGGFGEDEMTAVQVAAWRRYMAARDAITAEKGPEEADAVVALCVFDLGLNDQVRRKRGYGQKVDEATQMARIRAGLDQLVKFRDGWRRKNGVARSND